VIQLGESPDRVFFHGAPIVDALASLDLLPPDEVERRFDVRLPARTALVTFHPAVMDVAPPEELLDELLAALLAIEDLHIIVTGSNSDIGTADVRARIAAFAAANPARVDFVESFGQLGYLSAMRAAAVVAGNSSSTVLEAPVLGVPSVLIGDRQQGRPLAASVATPRPTREDIERAVRHALDADGGHGGAEVFGGPGFARRVAGTLAEHDIPRPPRKSFHDLERDASR
jgi:UDP-N-acetylglucosamine 2-epimerase